MSQSLPIRPDLRRTAPSADSVSGLSIGQYLIRRLQDYGIGHVFGIPGDYILGFYSLLEKSPLEIVGCTREDCAGFAADAYARVHGIGAVCVTYCVGGLSLCNSVAGAYAEKSPVVVITGSPGLRERVNNPLLHHRVRDFRTQYDVFEKICIAGGELGDPLIAFHEIDRVLHAAASYKRPVYIEIPATWWEWCRTAASVPGSAVGLRSRSAGRGPGRSRALDPRSQRPVIIAGVEVHRFGLQDELLALAEGSKIPITTTMLGKSVIPEIHPLFVGLYEGAMGKDAVTRFVEESDCVILLGTFMTDLNLGIYTANLDPGKCIYATSEQLRIRHHHFHGVLLTDFIQGLADAAPSRPAGRFLACTTTAKPSCCGPAADFHPPPHRPAQRISRRRNRRDRRRRRLAVCRHRPADPRPHRVLAPAYYTSMGFSIPAALGTQVARPDLRAVVVVGDGAFQMTGMELSTIVARPCPIVILLDNKGYGTERFLHPGNSFNEIHPWAYSKLPQVLGGGTGYEVRTEDEFDRALSAAWADRRA